MRATATQLNQRSSGHLRPAFTPAITRFRHLGHERLARRQGVGYTYEICGLLGQGGMGLVYRAHDHGTHRDIAVKVPLGRVGIRPHWHEAAGAFCG